MVLRQSFAKNATHGTAKTLLLNHCRKARTASQSGSLRRSTIEYVSAVGGHSFTLRPAHGGSYCGSKGQNNVVVERQWVQNIPSPIAWNSQRSRSTMLRERGLFAWRKPRRLSLRWGFAFCTSSFPEAVGSPLGYSHPTNSWPITSKVTEYGF